MVNPNSCESGRKAFGSPRRDSGQIGNGGSWGYRFLVVDDADGNQTFLHHPREISPSHWAIHTE
jgi:hypothetical protein